MFYIVCFQQRYDSFVKIQVTDQIILETEVNLKTSTFRQLLKLKSELNYYFTRIESVLIKLNISLMNLVSVVINLSFIIFPAKSIYFFAWIILKNCFSISTFFFVILKRAFNFLEIIVKYLQINYLFYDLKRNWRIFSFTEFFLDKIDNSYNLFNESSLEILVTSKIHANTG